MIFFLICNISLQEDRNAFVTLYNSKYDQIKSFDILGPVYTVWQMMAFNYKNTSSKTITILQNCLRNSKLRKIRKSETRTVLEKKENFTSESTEPTTAPTDKPIFPMNRLPTESSYLPVYLYEADNNQELCSRQFSLFQEYYSFYLAGTPINEIKNYEDAVKDIFMNGKFEYSSNQKYKKCLEEEDINPMERDIEITKEIKETALFLTGSSNIFEALSYANQLAARYQDIRSIVMGYAEMRENCYWYRDIVKEENKLVYETQLDINANIINIKQVTGEFVRIGRKYFSLNQNYMENIVPTLKYVEDYLLRNITKTKLRRLLELSTFKMAKENVLEYGQDLNQDIKYFIELVQSVQENTAVAYHKKAQLKIPILTTNNVYDLLIVQLAKDIDDVRMQEFVESLKHDLDPGLRDLVSMTFERIFTRVNEVKEKIIEPMEDLMEEIKEFSHSLQEYEQSTIMDTDFFM